jgi:murein L,D-transpeptidase YafK
MKKLIPIISLLLLAVLLGACAKAQWTPLFDYGDMTRPPTPTPAPTPTPDPNRLFAENPQQLNEPNIVVYKERHVLELRDGEKVVARIHVSLGTSPKGKKTEEGDGKTPEGSFTICFRNAQSKFYKSLVINYPNEEDADTALEDGAITQREHDAIVSAVDSGQKPPWNTALGGEIAICGYGQNDEGSTGDWTSGNVAVTNPEMDYLWQYVQMGTPVVIKP